MKDLTRTELLHLIDEALYCLKDYYLYGEKMRSIGRGYSGVGSKGQSIYSVIKSLQDAVDKSVM